MNHKYIPSDLFSSNALISSMDQYKEKYQQSFLIASHDYSITEIADRILYLKDGKIKEGI